MLTASAVVVNRQHPDAALAPGATGGHRVALTAMGLCAVGTWLLQHPYRGITHDAMLYTLFALNRLHPGEVANDIFLRFGSQDRFTIFAPVYAAAIDAFGLERAAALLTLMFQSALLLGAWLLARRFMPPLAATLGVALLAAVPGEYGSANPLHILEGFITPRLPAEALVVGALVAGLSERFWIAALCVAVAISLHPIMGCAGAAMLILTFVARSRPKWVAASGALAFAAALATVLALTPLGRIEGMWLYSVRTTSSYLFLENWSSNDWSRVALPLAILAIGALNGTAAPLRRLCAAALVMVACGLLITGIFGDLLHVAIFVAAQTWRWLWLANVLAFVLSPAIATDCWRRGDSGRIAVLVLVSAWIFRNLTPALVLIPLSVACAAVPDRWTTHRHWRGPFLAACVLVGLAAILDLTDRLSYLPGFDPTAPQFPDQVRAACEDAVIPGALLVAVWLLLRRSPAALRVATVLGLSTLVSAAVLPLAWREWTHTDYTPELIQQIAPWRAGMSPSAEILWDNPVGSWYLLERPNYWSAFQAAGAIFSRDTAILLEQRSAALAQATEASGSGLAWQKAQHSAGASSGSRPPEGVIPLNLAGMQMACADPALTYIVSWLPVAPTPYPSVAFTGRRAHGKLYLYRCADLRN